MKADPQAPAVSSVSDREAWKKHLRNWPIYAAAAGAALATASRAEADTIYSGPLNLVFSPSVSTSQGKRLALPQPVTFQIHNGNGTFARPVQINEGIGGPEREIFGIRASSFAFQLSSLGGVWNFFPLPEGSKRYVHDFMNFGVEESGPRVRNTGLVFPDRRRTSHVSGHMGAPLPVNTFPVTNRHNNFGYPGSKFNLTGGGFVGFERVDAGYNYGWIHLDIFKTQGGNQGIDIHSWAWNTNGPALVPSQVTPQTPEPGSGSLALLASGAAGLVAFRKRHLQRQEKQAPTAAE